jgi:hypothetical protein
MKRIEYRVHYSGELVPGSTVITGDPSEDVVAVQARDINAGYAKALKQAREPLGNGRRREIVKIEFWQIP